MALVGGSSLPWSKKIAYAAGNASGQFLQWAFVSYFVYYFSPTEGVGKTILPIAVTTGIVFYSRFVDGFLEPFVGYWSDNCKSRWGRRIPFLMFGGLPMCLFFLLMWIPPFAPGSTAMIVWVATFQILFWFGVTAVFCPYLGLLPEITETSQDRVIITQVMQIFLLLATGVIMAMPAFLPIKYGKPGAPIIASILALVSVYLPVFFIKEKQHLPGDDEEHYGILEALWWTLTNRAFVTYLVSTLFLLLGFQTIMNSMLHIVTALLHKGQEFLPVIFGVCLVSVLLSFVLIIFLQKTISKKILYLASILGMALVMPLIYFLGGPRVLGLPTLPVAFIIFFLIGLPMAGMMSLQTPILADIADADEKTTGHRREAMFFGAQGFLQKFAIAATSLIQGYLFTRYGYSVANPLGVRLLGPVTGFFVFFGFVVFLFYNLDEKTKTIVGNAKTLALMYVLSFFLPILGLPIGMKYRGSSLAEERAEAKVCFALSWIGILFYVSLITLRIAGISPINYLKQFFA